MYLVNHIGKPRLVDDVIAKGEFYAKIYYTVINDENGNPHMITSFDKGLIIDYAKNHGEVLFQEAFYGIKKHHETHIGYYTFKLRMFQKDDGKRGLLLVSIRHDSDVVNIFNHAEVPASTTVGRPTMFYTKSVLVDPVDMMI